MLPDRNFQKSPIWTLKFAKIAIFRAQNRGNIATFLANFHYFLPWLTLFIAFLCDNVFKNWNLYNILITFSRKFSKNFSIWNFEKCEDFVTFEMPSKAQISQKLPEFYVKSRENRRKLTISQNRGKFRKNRVRFLQKSYRQLTLQNRGIGDKSRSLATLLKCQSKHSRQSYPTKLPTDFTQFGTNDKEML